MANQSGAGEVGRQPAVWQKDGKGQGAPVGLGTRIVSVFKGASGPNAAERRWHRQHNG